jgi:hypothetical protein
MEFIRKGNINNMLYYKDNRLLELPKGALILYGSTHLECTVWLDGYTSFVYKCNTILYCGSEELTAFYWLHDFHYRLRDRNTGQVNIDNITESDIQHLLKLANTLDIMCLQLDAVGNPIIRLTELCGDCFTYDRPRDNCAACEEGRATARQILTYRPTTTKSARN